MSLSRKTFESSNPLPNGVVWDDEIQSYTGYHAYEFNKVYNAFLSGMNHAIDTWEVVEYQYCRRHVTRQDDPDAWGDWDRCSRKIYDDIKKNPFVLEWEYKTREIFALKEV